MLQFLLDDIPLHKLLYCTLKSSKKDRVNTFYDAVTPAEFLFHKRLLFITLEPVTI